MRERDVTIRVKKINERDKTQKPKNLKIIKVQQKEKKGKWTGPGMIRERVK